MTDLSEVFSTRLMEDMVRGGFVRRQFHPTEPFAILNYAEKAVFDKVWNEVTLQCRGLIYNTKTGRVVARPFRKFFNHNEGSAPVIPLDTPVTVTDKQDGSLGILYHLTSGQPAIATRGSFMSEQAQHATELFRRRYSAASEAFPNDWTVLFEIIYPENRIVVDYGQLDDLVLLGAVSISNGRSIGPEKIHGWQGPRTSTLPYRTFAEALAAPPRKGMEGVVVHDVETDERVKIKQEDYVALHRIVTGLTSRRVHEAMLAGIDLDQFIAPLPDEFHDWVRAVADDIDFQVRESNAAIDSQWAMTVAECEERSPEPTDPGTPGDQGQGAPHLSAGGWPASVSMGLDTGHVLTRDQRKLFADVARKHSFAWALFSRLDGKDYQEKLLKMAQPEIETPSGREFTEATA